ncbi:MAG TPA: hypothetical protein VF039_00230 [Longimicrobiales bacterium]
MSEIDERPIDLSALDPERDAGRWDALVAATVARADAALAARSRSALDTIAGWSRPLLLAAALLVALLVPAEMLLDARERRAEQVQRLVTISVDWSRGDAPTGSELARALTPGARP